MNPEHAPSVETDTASTYVPPTITDLGALSDLTQGGGSGGSDISSGTIGSTA